MTVNSMGQDVPAAVLLALLFVPAMAAAQTMNDPMRPPTEFAADESAPATATTSGGGLVLQSVFISPTLKSAVISGETVKLGDMLGGAKLVKIAENEVVLKNGDETQVLKMYPGVEKNEIVQAAAKPAPKRARAAAPKPGAGDNAKARLLNGGGP